MISTKKSQARGFTLIEILVVIGIIAVLAAIVIIAINPSRQFAQARDSQRTSNVNAILNAIGQNIADNKGTFTCDDDIPELDAEDADEAPVIADDDLNLRECLVPDYLPEIPVDPETGTAWDEDDDTYDTHYTVYQDDDSGRITVAAVGEITPIISVTR